MIHRTARKQQNPSSSLPDSTCSFSGLTPIPDAKVAKVCLVGFVSIEYSALPYSEEGWRPPVCILASPAAHDRLHSGHRYGPSLG